MRYFITCPEFIQLLLEYGADTEQKDANGDVALNYFIRNISYCIDRNLQCVCLPFECGAGGSFVRYTNRTKLLRKMRVYLNFSKPNVK